jgi:hypothetical protein
MKPDEKLYELASNELKESPRQGLLIKCVAKSGGDEQKGKALYIKRRVTELKSESSKNKFQGFRLKFHNGLLWLKDGVKSLSQKYFPSRVVIFSTFLVAFLFSIWTFNKTQPEIHDNFPYFLGFWIGSFFGLFIPSYLIGLLLRFLSKGKIILDITTPVFFFIAILICSYGLSKDNFRFSKDRCLKRNYWYTSLGNSHQLLLDFDVSPRFRSEFTDDYRRVLEEQNHPFKDLTDIELTRVLVRKIKDEGRDLIDMPQDFQDSVARKSKTKTNLRNLRVLHLSRSAENQLKSAYTKKYYDAVWSWNDNPYTDLTIEIEDSLLGFSKFTVKVDLKKEKLITLTTNREITSTSSPIIFSRIKNWQW